VDVEAGELWIISSNLAPANAGKDVCCWVKQLKTLTSIWEGDGVDVLQSSIKSLRSVSTSNVLKNFILELT
jgi:hypothetical protein